jgi:branched-chain amino acid transport system ATP-binding protein
MNGDPVLLSEDGSIDSKHPNTEPVLEVSGLSVSYGGVMAVRQVSLEVRPGQIVGLIGPNGAGKTSLIDAITGFARCSGSVRLEGSEIRGLRPYRRAQLGLRRTFQAGELFNDLSVADNLRAALLRRTWISMVRDMVWPRAGQSAEAIVANTLNEFHLTEHRDSTAGDLTAGRQRLASIARAMVSEPSLLLLDEPAAGLDSFETADLAGVLRNLRTKMSMLLIDHDMGLVLSVCDYIYVLDVGSLIASGPPDEIRHDSRVMAAYLGSGGSRDNSEVSGSAE